MALKAVERLASVDRNGQATSSPTNLAELAGKRARNFFEAHHLSCSEAALLVINEGFGGGLSPDQAIAMGSGFGGGIGNSGCVCGALSGAVMGMGLLVGPRGPFALEKKEFRKGVGHFHDQFQQQSGAVCCRNLIADFRKGSRARKNFCADLTEGAVRDAVAYCLEKRPEISRQAHLEFLAGRDSRLSLLVGKLFRPPFAG
ncbi:MAG: C-GCAxxG-C-C family protein [Proteobacteria bacterium]|nr:C-GCAxxG-C-C family protein [Pseudomonadota bacterium]MBU1685825.1 C-GCAxxG-C-C family protein [Pseudomonadota bacterium]